MYLENKVYHASPVSLRNNLRIIFWGKI